MLLTDVYTSGDCCSDHAALQAGVADGPVHGAGHDGVLCGDGGQVQAGHRQPLPAGPPGQ